MTWPPPEPAEPEVPHRPWDPGHPRAKGLMDEHERLVYVVVDEIVDRWVGLSVSPWPHADGDGRLRFPDAEAAVDVGTALDALQRFLGAGDPEAEEPRVGRAFAARAKGGDAAKLLHKLDERAEHGEARVADLGKILEDPVDLTEQARLIAKLACYGAMLSAVPSDIADDWELQEEVET